MSAETVKVGRIKTKRWNDPVEKDDGLRVLVTRYRPRGVRKERENWDEWVPQLGPSVDLHADAYGKGPRPAIDFAEYRARYLEEMKSQQAQIARLAGKVGTGETVTLLCSSACTDAAECHRTLLRVLVYEFLGQPPPDEPTAKPSPVHGMSPALKKWLA